MSASWSLRRKLIAGASLLILSVGVGLVAVNYVLTERALNESTDALRARVGKELDLAPQVLLAPTRKGQPPVPFPTQVPDGRPTLDPADIPLRKSGMRLVSQPTEGIAISSLLDVYDDQLRSDALRSLLQRSAIVLALAGLMSWLVASLLARQFLHPMARMTATARQISGDNLTERFDVEGPSDEFKRLGDTFDALLDRVEGAFRSQSRFVADASHELKTPLAVIRTHTDLAKGTSDVDELQSYIEVIRKVSLRNEDLVDRLLTLARSDGELETEPADLAELAGEVLDSRTREGVTVRRNLSAAPVRGDRLLLERMIVNLLDNANAYNVPDGWIEVRTFNDGAGVVVEVANPTAAGAEGIAALVEPFARGAEDHRDGWGLGLAIVRSVAQAHGGSLQIEGAPGSVAKISVRLPRS